MSTSENTISETQITDTPLAGLERGALSAYFKTLSDEARGDIDAFRPTISSLSSLIAKIQDAGIDGVGLQIPTYSALRELKIIDVSAVADKNAEKSDMPQDVKFALLNIYDARFVIRVHPENVIDCHPVNINKFRRSPILLDSIDFWEPKIEHVVDGKKTSYRQPEYFTYDLAREKDSTEFVASVLQVTAACEARNNLLQYDRPAAKRTSKISKPLPSNLNGKAT